MFKHLTLKFDYDLYQYYGYTDSSGIFQCYISRSTKNEDKIFGSYYSDEIESEKIIRSAYGKEELENNISKYKKALEKFKKYLIFE